MPKENIERAIKKASDKTTEILKDKNISYLTTEKNSGGPNKGRNIALKHSSGDFICIADHDDIWFPNKVISLLKKEGFYINSINKDLANNDRCIVCTKI